MENKALKLLRDLVEVLDSPRIKLLQNTALWQKQLDAALAFINRPQEKVNPALPLDIEREREAFKEFKQRTRKSAYLYIDHDFRLMNFSHTGEIYANPAIQSEFELWIASASIPRPVPAEPAQEPIGYVIHYMGGSNKERDSPYYRDMRFDNKVDADNLISGLIPEFQSRYISLPIFTHPQTAAQPIGQAWGVWCDRAYRESGFVNYDGIITLYNENKANEMVEKFKEMNLEPFKYEKRPLYIYEAQQPPQAPAAPQIQPNAWLPFKDAPRDLDESVDLWDQKEGRIPDCYFDSLLLRWRNSFGVVRVSNVTHFMVVNPPIDFLME